MNVAVCSKCFDAVGCLWVAATCKNGRSWAKYTTDPFIGCFHDLE